MSFCSCRPSDECVTEYSIEIFIVRVMEIETTEPQNTPFSLQSVPSEQLNVYQQLFSFFDKDDSGSIPISSVGTYIRGLGHCPTEAQLKSIKQQFGHPQIQQVSFSDLVCLVAQRPKQSNIEQQLLEAFEAYRVAETGNVNSKNSNPCISINGLRRFLAENGEVFNETEAQAFSQFLKVNGLKVNESEFNYRDLSRIMTYNYLQ